MNKILGCVLMLPAVVVMIYGFCRADKEILEGVAIGVAIGIGLSSIIISFLIGLKLLLSV